MLKIALKTFSPEGARYVSNKLIVGAQQGLKGLCTLKKEENVNLVIDLRKNYSSFFENIKCKLLGIKHVSIPTKLLQMPSNMKSTFDKIAKAIDVNKNGRVYIHCRDGRHRSVLACAYSEILNGNIKNFKELDYFLKYHHYFVVKPRKTIFSIFKKADISKMKKRIEKLKVQEKDFADAFLPKNA